MADATQERRMQQRCTKDVGMHCSYVHGGTDQIVTLRNYSSRGMYFESAWEIQPGTLIVLRAMDVNDAALFDPAIKAPQFSIGDSDPEACLGYRSHAVAKVMRCVKLDDHGDQPHFGVGAEMQILTD